ncbi:hypothetical protein CKO35_04020 [Ectothiorhodospira shaposhnikovii]|uniref:sulfotransferase family 2 domain-containing protein n=1 Tax=Ectothiorhodospira shaposhnikovii TaxID=1054 RepID=UPI001903383C|nr:sulfotransferase family 2 domain-containing protein [Ectothiorhodospira shaposhnikovii]MBK1672475.1 hypothetical protein [Ectothiorhodospira shaposhnikovii]
MPRSNDLFFIHIPKTAGTSLRHGLATLPELKLICDYGHGNPLTAKMLKRFAQDGCTTRLLSELPADKSVIFCGHVHYSKYAHLVPSERTLALVRNPIERLVSEYQHLARRQSTASREFGIFIREKQHQNLQYRVLKGLNIHHALIGLSTHYEDYAGMVRHRIGINIPCLAKNRTPRRDVQQRHYLRQEDINTAFELNTTELGLFFDIAETFQKKLQQMGKRICTSTAWHGDLTLSLENDQMLTGSLPALDNDSLFPVLDINGQPRAIAAAKKTKGKLTDVATFNFQYPISLLGAAPGDTIGVSLLGIPDSRRALVVPKPSIPQPRTPQRLVQWLINT